MFARSLRQGKLVVFGVDGSGVSWKVASPFTSNLEGSSFLTTLDSGNTRVGKARYLDADARPFLVKCSSVHLIDSPVFVCLCGAMRALRALVQAETIGRVTFRIMSLHFA